MEVARLKLKSDDHEHVKEHLHSGASPAYEEAAFLFCQPQIERGLLTLATEDLWCLPPEAFASRSELYLKLTDQTRAAIIKRAHDIEASLVEVHCHPRQRVAQFSWSDMSGFEEFVPHVRWRLQGRPYAAIVCTTTSFDSLAWLDSNGPAGWCSIAVDAKIMRPTGMTYSAEWTSQ